MWEMLIHLAMYNRFLKVICAVIFSCVGHACMILLPYGFLGGGLGRVNSRIP